MKLKEFQSISFSQTHKKNKSLFITLVALISLSSFFIGRLSSNYNTYTPSSPQQEAITHEVKVKAITHEVKVKASYDLTNPPHDLFNFKTQCSKPLPDNEVIPKIIELVFQNTSPYAHFPSPETSKHLIRRRPRGWGSRNPVFRDLISSVKPATIIELGTFLGASALNMASITRNLSLESTAILCLDDFRGWPGFQSKISRDVPASYQGDSMLLHQFMINVVQAGETERVMPVPFSTGSALAALCEWGIYGDLIEVDAGHDFHSAWADINMAWAVLKPGGVLFGHDYFTMADNRGVRRAVNLFAQVKGLKIKPHGQHWVLSPKPHG